MHTTFHKTFRTLLLWAGVALAQTPSGRLAVLEIENTTGSNQSFVRSMPNMIVTELLQRTGEQLVERGQIESAMKELGLKTDSVTQDGSRQVGRWVGADRILLGALSQINGNQRLDLRVIEVASGRILNASEATVQENLQELVPMAVEKLAASLSPKYTQRKTTTSLTQVVAQGSQTSEQGRCRLQINHRITLSLLTEKPVPFQIVRIFVDHQLVGASPMLNEVNKDYVLFDELIPPGDHVLTLEHGVVSKAGVWKRDLEEPAEVSFRAPEGGERTISYRMHVGSARFKFEDFEAR